MTRRLASAAVAAAVVALLVTAVAARAPRAGVAPTLPYAVWVVLDGMYAQSDLPPAVGPDALALRELLDTDRPISPDAIARIEETGARVRYASRWLRAVSVDADAAMLRRLARMDGVRAIVPLRSMEAGGLASTTTLLESMQDSTVYGATWRPLSELNIPVLHQPALDFTGSGIRIAILDTGFNLTHETVAGRTVARQRDFVNNDNDVSNQPGDPLQPDAERHGTFVWSLMAAHRPGRMVGGAYNATFYLAKVDIPVVDTRGDEDRWVAAIEWADSLGVRLVNSSIGFRGPFLDRPTIPYGDLDGNTTITTRMADEAARRGILVVVAIGNAGPNEGTLWAPADADSVIVVGAAEPLNGGRATAATISSRGPTADGRVKPDVVARGTNLTAASSIAPAAYEVGLSGSSYSAPLITAAAALFMEAWPALSIMAVRDALRMAGSDARAPNNNVGYGLPDVAAAVMMPDGLHAVRATPTDVDGKLTTIAPTFFWSAALIHSRMRPIRYTLEVASDSFFVNTIYTDTVSEAFSLTARQPIRSIDQAWWRVTARSESGVTRVTAQQPPITVPAWVRLLTLTGQVSEFITETRPELSWAPLSAPAPIGPFTYDVQVLTSAGTVIQTMRNLQTSSVRVPDPLTPNQAYRWRVIARTATGVADTVESGVPFVIESNEAPPATILYPPFPNPFPNFVVGHSSMHVWFDLSQATGVTLSVHDTRGRLVRQLIPARPECGRDVQLPAGQYGRSGQSQPPGVNGECVLTEWDGRNRAGDRVPRGVYIVRLRAAGVEDVQRILFLPD